MDSEESMNLLKMRKDRFFTIFKIILALLLCKINGLDIFNDFFVLNITFIVYLQDIVLFFYSQVI